MRCPKCGEDKPLTKHHVFPSRFKWRRSLRRITVKLCRQCHDLLEKHIPQYEQMPEDFYENVVDDFLKGDL